MTIHTFRKSLISALALLAALAFNTLGFTQASAHPKRAPQFSILGKGTIAVEPDIAYISTGIISEGETAEAALNQNSTRMADVFEVLEKAGIERKHIQTSNFSIQPRYVYHNPKKGAEQRPPRIVGYTVNNTVTVKIVQLDNTGMVISEVVKFGSNSLDNIRFGISNREELMDEARTKAVLDAKRKADIYTKAAGVTLGRVLEISEGGGSIRPRRFQATALKARVAEAVPAPVSGGETNISVTVNMTWELEQ